MKTALRIISAIGIGLFLACAGAMFIDAIHKAAIFDQTQEALDQVDRDTRDADEFIRKSEAQREAEAKWQAEQIARAQGGK